MPFAPARITVRTLMAAVAVVAWVLFNSRLIGQALGEFMELSPWEPVWGLAPGVLAWLVGPTAGMGVAHEVWSNLMLDGQPPWRSGLVAGAAAGFAGWAAAAVPAFVGHGAAITYLPLAAGVTGLVGMLLNLLPGMFVGAAWGLRHRDRARKLAQ